MDQIFRQLPPRVLAFLALAVGLVFILLNDPPRTVCDSQLEVFRESQKRFLFGGSQQGVSHTALIERYLENCRRGNGPGGCYELFDGLKRMAGDIENIPKSCAEIAGEIPQIRRGIWESLDLMALLAWGEKPPLSYSERNGWLDAADVALFCRLKGRALALYGSEGWNSFRLSVSAKLPGAQGLNPEQVWQRSILATSCDNYR